MSPGFDALRAEQAPVQELMNRQRRIAEYESEYLFPSMDSPGRSDPISELLAPACADPELSLAGILRGMSVANQRPAHWVDKGGGYAIALRQVAASPENAGRIKTTNVDLFNLDPNDLDLINRGHLERITPGILSEAAAPQYVQANIETVHLEEEADFTTLIEVIQYLNNPLQAICNSYNQTKVGGFVVASTSYFNWSTFIRYQNDETEGLPVADTIHELERNEIPVAYCTVADARDGTRWRLPADFRTLAIQKKAGTVLRVNIEPVLVRFGTGPYKHYKNVHYRMPPKGVLPVSVVATEL